MKGTVEHQGVEKRKKKNACQYTYKSQRTLQELNGIESISSTV